MTWKESRDQMRGLSLGRCALAGKRPMSAAKQPGLEGGVWDGGEQPNFRQSSLWQHRGFRLAALTQFPSGG